MSTPKQKIGTYVIDSTIGKGNFSVVKLATHTITQMKVAIKVIDKENMTPANLLNVRREANIMKKLRHKSIIQLYQVMESARLLYIVMEYAPGGELFEKIANQGRFTEDAACDNMLQVLDAVEYCHSAGIVHRDIKSENILFDASGNIKLTDFGFGHVYEEGMNLSTYCGSPPYAPPEIFLGVPYDGKKVDIWSLGVLLYVLVCGSFPFDAPTLKLLKEQVVHGCYRVPFFMSHECEEVLRHMLAKRPNRRPSIEKVRTFKWFQMRPTSSSSSSVLRIGHSQSECAHFHELALRVLERSNMPKHLVVQSLEREAYDHLMATYLLLVEKLKLSARHNLTYFRRCSHLTVSSANATDAQPRRHSMNTPGSSGVSPVTSGVGPSSHFLDPHSPSTSTSNSSTSGSGCVHRRFSEFVPSSTSSKEAAETHHDAEWLETCLAHSLEIGVTSTPKRAAAVDIQMKEQEGNNSSLTPQVPTVATDFTPRSSFSGESGVGMSSDSDCSRRQSSARSSVSSANPSGGNPWRMSIPSPQLYLTLGGNTSIDEGLELEGDHGISVITPHDEELRLRAAKFPNTGEDTREEGNQDKAVPGTQAYTPKGACLLTVPTDAQREVRRKSDIGVLHSYQESSSPSCGLDSHDTIHQKPSDASLDSREESDEDPGTNVRLTQPRHSACGSGLVVAQVRKLGEMGRVGGVLFLADTTNSKEDLGPRRSTEGKPTDSKH